MDGKLFDDSEVFQKERPAKITDAQLEAMYREIATEIASEYSDDDIDNIVNDLKNVSFYNSGYEIAKSLEWKKCSYDFSPQFIEFLDDLQWRRSEIVSQNVRDWVKATNPQPQYEIGTALVCREAVSASFKTGDVVYGYDRQEARYKISRELGADTNTLIPYEKLEATTVIHDNPGLLKTK